MKLLRFGSKGKEKPGMLDADGMLRDLSSVIDDIAGSALSDTSLQRLREIDPTHLPLVEGSPRIGACVGQVGKFICIGLNYDDHAAEANMAIPEEPIVFLKATSAICGANDPIEIPRGSSKTDWELELAVVVVGKEAKYVSVEEAMSHIAGYCIANDVSERDFQLRRSGQWVKGKSADTFGPIGPWLVTRDEIADPQDLKMTLGVYGKRFQDGSTKTMQFSVAAVVSYLSQFMSRQRGDVISTGTPPRGGDGAET